MSDKIFTANKKTPPPAGGGWGVIDLGTNTFHLLIAEGSAAAYREIVHQHIGVKIGEGGINKGVIQPAAFERGIKALQHFHDLILKNNVKEVRAIGTSALRNAANGGDFIMEVKKLTGIAIEIIDGEKEAAYIYKGINASGCLSKQNSLIVDIGGGSVEFIIANNEGIKWKQSFEIGCARLMDKFHQTDPIPSNSIDALNIYLEDQLKALFTATADYTMEGLIGASGAFETYAEVIGLEKGHPFDLATTKNYEFDRDELLNVIEKLIHSSHEERLVTKGIVSLRTDMIVVASLLTRFIIEKLNIYNVVMSTSSLKEGVLAEMIGE